MKAGATLITLLVAASSLAAQATAQDIFEAARDGDVSAVRVLLDQDQSLALNTDDRNCTPPHFAAGTGQQWPAGAGIDGGGRRNRHSHAGRSSCSVNQAVAGTS